MRNNCINQVFFLLGFFILQLTLSFSLMYGQEKKSPYIWLLKECNQEVFKKTFEYPFLAVLDEDDRIRYEEFKSLDAKKSFIFFYWKEQNPNPFQEENEYLQKFIDRCQYVQKNFSCSEPPYFDDRGKYYLRYGEPLFRYTQPARTKYVDFFREEMRNPFHESDNELTDNMEKSEYVSVQNFLGKMIGKGVDAYEFLPQVYSIRANESWVYRFLSEGRQEELIYHFIDEGDSFREIESLEDVIIHPHKIKIRFFYWADLIKDRANALQSRTVFNAYEDILDFEAEIKSAGDKGVKYFSFYSSGYDIMNPHNKFMNINNTLKVKLTNQKLNVPATVFASENTREKLFFHYDIVQFRGNDNKTTVAIHYFIPLKENFNIIPARTQSGTIRFHYRSLFQDQMLERVIEKNSEKLYDMLQFSRLGLPYLIEGMQFSLLPRMGRISLEVEDKVTEKLGFIKRNVNLRDFSGPDLCISDIQFCEQIEDSLYREFCPVYHTNGVSVIPYPYEKIKKSDPLFCYFEIYNIKTGGIQTQYEISLEVTTAGGKKTTAEQRSIKRKSSKNSISIHQTREVDRDDTRELIGVDFSNLKKGNYILSIRVTDEENPDVRAEVKRNLQIVN